MQANYREKASHEALKSSKKVKRASSDEEGSEDAPTDKLIDYRDLRRRVLICVKSERSKRDLCMFLASVFAKKDDGKAFF